MLNIEIEFFANLKITLGSCTFLCNFAKKSCISPQSTFCSNISKNTVVFLVGFDTQKGQKFQQQKGVLYSNIHYPW